MPLFSRSGAGGHGHIDRSTGRNKREAVNHRDSHGGGPKRQGGKVVPKGKLQHQRDRNTDKK